MDYFIDEDKEIIIGKLNEFFIEQIRLSNKLTEDFRVEGSIDKVIISAAGTNKVAAELLKEYIINTIENDNENGRLRKKLVPPEIHISTGFSIDKFNPTFNSVVIFLSLDYKEVETLHMIRNTLRSGAKTIGITASQKLLRFFKEHSIKSIDLTELYSLVDNEWFNLTQRKQENIDVDFKENSILFTPALMTVLLKTFSNLNLISSQNDEINKTIMTIEKSGYGEMGGKIAESTFNKIPLLYMQSNLKGLAMHWKTSFNTLAAVPSFISTFPELGYDEIATFELPLMSDFYILTISFEPETKEDTRTNETIKIAKEIIKKKGVSVTEIRLKGVNLLTKIFSSMLLSNTTALHLRRKLLDENDFLEPNKLLSEYSRNSFNKLKLR